MNKYKKNMSMKNVSNFIKKVAQYEIDRSGDKDIMRDKTKLCFDYFVATKNSELLQSYKEIYGLSGKDMKDMHDYYKNSGHEYSQSIGGNDPDKNSYRIMVNVMNEYTDYDRRRSISFIADALKHIRSYRKDAKKRSLLDTNHVNKPDVSRKWAKVSLRTAYDWWSANHDRTSISLGVQDMPEISLDKYGHDKGGRDVIKKDKPYDNVDKTYTVQAENTKDSWSKRNNLLIPPLWYLKIYRHGLSTVVYKSRPCMVIKANPMPIQRLKDKGIDVYKADIIKSHHGVIDVIRDLFLVSHQTRTFQKHPEGKRYLRDNERTFAPQTFDTIGECHTACNENLRIAENTISGRLVSGIANALDI